jgi:DNA-binding transcriptional LysR family regulator
MGVMEIDYLRTFASICDLGSFTAAARQVGRTQSAVSLQIRRIEDLLGRPLFERSKGNITLTQHGEIFLVSARRIITAYDEALRSFDRSSIEGTVVLGLPEDYAPRILTAGIAGFTELYPQATLDLLLDESKQLSRSIVNGTVDLAFITTGEGVPHQGSDVFQDRVVWVGPIDGALHLRDPLPVAVWREDDTYAQMMIDALQREGRSYRITTHTRSMAGLRAAVTSGLAVTVMVESSKTSDMIELLPEDGFPKLRSVTVKLVKGRKRKAPVIDRLEQHLLNMLQAQD